MPLGLTERPGTIATHVLQGLLYISQKGAWEVPTMSVVF